MLEGWEEAWKSALTAMCLCGCRLHRHFFWVGFGGTRGEAIREHHVNSTTVVDRNVCDGMYSPVVRCRACAT